MHDVLCMGDILHHGSRYQCPIYSLKMNSLSELSEITIIYIKLAIFGSESPQLYSGCGFAATEGIHVNFQTVHDEA